MASLSELLAEGSSGPALPGWMVALQDERAFIEGPRWAEVGAPDVPSEGEAIELALAEAYASGEAAGREAARSELAVEDRQREALRLAFGELDEVAKEELAKALSLTVLALCEPVLVESAIDAHALAARCEEAARRFGSAAGQITLRLHPEDTEALDPAKLGDWTVKPDAALERGSIRLENSEGSLADGPTEWRAAIAAALGG